MKNGYTLAEVLITIGIIGIVSAITIPMLVQNYQKKLLVMKLKQTYSILSNAMKMSIAENGDNSAWVYNNINEYAETYWLPYIKTIKTCKSFSECGYKSSSPWYCKDSNKVAKCVYYWNSGNQKVGIILLNGTYVFLTGNTLYIDTNGNLGPNETGKDFFVLKIGNNSLLPYSSYSISQCTKDGYKWDCLAKIIKDGWEIKSNYPW